MKTIAPILFCAFLVFTVACKKKTKAADNEENIQVQMNAKKASESNTVEFKEAKNCDEFIDQYEAWMDEYVALMEKYKEAPVDLVSSPEYVQMTLQATDWASKWSTNITACATNSSYEKRFKEINQKAEKKLKEIGLR